MRTVLCHKDFLLSLHFLLFYRYYLSFTAPCQTVRGHIRIASAIRMQQLLKWRLMCYAHTHHIVFSGTGMIKTKKCPIPTETAVRTVTFNQLKPDENAGLNTWAPAEIAMGFLMTPSNQNFHLVLSSKRQTVHYHRAA